MPAFTPVLLHPIRSASVSPPPAYEQIDSHGAQSAQPERPIQRSDDVLEQSDNRKFSPLCRRVLAREHHRALALSMPKIPVATERLHHGRLVKDVEELIANGFTAQQLQPLIDLSAGEALLDVLVRCRTRLLRLDFDPGAAAAMVLDLHQQQHLSAPAIQARILALFICNIDCTAYAQINSRCFGSLVIKFIENHCHRLYRLPHADQICVEAAAHISVLNQLLSLMDNWNILLHTGLNDEQIVSVLIQSLTYRQLEGSASEANAQAFANR